MSAVKIDLEQLPIGTVIARDSYSLGHVELEKMPEPLAWGVRKVARRYSGEPVEQVLEGDGSDREPFFEVRLVPTEPSPRRIGGLIDLDEPVVGAWTAMNDVEERDGYMHWAIFEYVLEPNEHARRLTQYDLSNAEAWAVVHSHNAGMGFE